MEIYILVSKYRDEDSEILGVFSSKDKMTEGFLKILKDGGVNTSGHPYTPTELLDYAAQLEIGAVEIGRAEYWWLMRILDWRQ